jgi:hypothetical protein
MSLGNLAKILKCAGNDDIVTMKAADDGDTVTFMFEAPSECACTDAVLDGCTRNCCCKQFAVCGPGSSSRGGVFCTYTAATHTLGIDVTLCPYSRQLTSRAQSSLAGSLHAVFSEEDGVYCTLN